MAYKRQRKHQSLGTDYYIERERERDKTSQRRGKIKSTIERRRPPAWDPPILLQLDSHLEVAAILGVVEVVVGGGSWLRGSVV